MYSGTVGPTSIVKPPSPRDMKREQTAGYENAQAFAYMQPRKLPLWSLYMADWMRMDHQVWFGLCVSNAPLMTAKVKVEGPNKRVNAFVQEQWDRIWDSSAPKILRTKTYGYGGYEAVYRYEDDHWEFDYLLDRHPRDVKPLIDTTTKQLVGVSVTQSGKDGMYGPVKMLHPKGVWLTYCAEFGQHFGRALLERAYPAWYDKVCSGGAYDMRRLRCMKDAWLGDRFRYPLEDVILPDGTKLSARDVARQIGENRTSGAAMALPSVRDEQGNYKWDYEPPYVIAGENQAQLWIENLDDDIFDGLLLPKEVVEAATTGSGFSGRSIPMLAFLSTRDVEFASYVEDIDTQIIAPLVRLRFGKDADDYDIKPVPLAETFGEQVGQGPAGGAVGNGEQVQRDPLNPGSPMTGAHRAGAMQFSTGPHSYASTQLSLPSLNGIVAEFQKRIKPEDIADGGLETETHVTVKYGLADVSQGAATSIIQSFQPITVLLGDLELFENDEHDVLYVAVDGGEPLRQLHEQLSLLPNQDSHPDYRPHMTLAYLKPGKGKNYLDADDFKGKSETVTAVQWSSTDGNRLSIPLQGGAQPSAIVSPQFSSWEESKHPRGQPENAGQFGPGGGGTAKGKGRKGAEAVKDYSTDKFQQINSALRGESETTPEVKAMVASMDSFLERAPKTPGVTFRSINIPPGREQEFANMFTEGATLSDKAFLSTRASATPSVRAAFSGHAAAGTINVKVKGRSGVDISHLSENPGETEILYPRNTRFRVVQTKTTTTGGVLALLEEIDEAEQFSIADPPPRSNKVLDRATEAGNVIADDIRRRLAELLVKKKRLI